MAGNEQTASYNRKELSGSSYLVSYLKLTFSFFFFVSENKRIRFVFIYISVGLYLNLIFVIPPPRSGCKEQSE